MSKVIERKRYSDGERGRGSLIRYNDSTFWFSSYYLRGKEHRESTRETDFELAKRVHKKVLDRIGADRAGLKHFVTPTDRRLRVGELLDALVKDYELRGKACQQFCSHLKPIREYFGDWLALNLTSEAVDIYIEGRRQAKRAPATINRETQLLGQALQLALRRRRLTSVPHVRQLPENNTREDFFNRAEVEALVANLPEDLQDFTRWGWLTGWRKGEIASLRWADVDRDGRSLRLSWRHSKNGHARTMALVGDLGDIIDRRSAARTITTKQGASVISPLVFHRGEGRGKHEGEVAPVADFDRAWKTACAAAGLPAGSKVQGGRIFHGLRRSAARNLRNAGVPENVCMAITGHRTRAMFDRYAIANDKDTADAMTKLQAHIQAQATESKVLPLRKAAEGRQ
jgi:integrase